MPPVENHCFNKITLTTVQMGAKAETENPAEQLLQSISER